MDKDLIKASLAFFLMFMVWQTFFVKKPVPSSLADSQKNKINTQTAEVVSSTPSKVEKKVVNSESVMKSESKIDESKLFEESCSSLKSSVADISVSNRGFGLKVAKFDKYEEEISFNGESYPLSIVKIGNFTDLQSREFLVNSDNKNISGSCKLNDKLQLLTNLSFTDNDYLFSYTVTVKNVSEEDLFFDGLEIVAGNLFLGKGKSRPILNCTQYTVEEKAINVAYKKIKGKRIQEDQFYWGGVQNKAFCSLLKGEDLFRKTSFVRNTKINNEENVSTSVTTVDFSVPAHSEKVFVFNYYLGPKLFFHLKDLNLTFENVIDYGSIIGPITKWLVMILNFLFIYTKNYGISIIILTVLFKLGTYPLTKKSMVSMKEMQKLQPQIKQLQEQYKSNPGELNKATMALYKKYKINPLSSCFPMLIQMPLFFAFFKAISNSVELQGASFWLIKNLAAPDALIPLGTKVVGLGTHLNILPLVLGVIQFISSKQTITDPKQKAMLYGMPVFMTVIFYKMPSALVLYFFVSTLIGIIQNKMIKSPSDK